ncbi:MAG: TonB-dependent receptor [Pyrinomonadaceae bacterium]
MNYQLDGNTISDAGRAGVRLLVIPETFVQEIQFVSNAFAPEFGNTPGVIMNMVTPSGTNDLDGSLAYLFRLPRFYSRPFGYTSSEELLDSRVQDVALKLGAPIIVDRAHIFAGYEQYVKDDKGIPNRLLTITEANKAALIAGGLPASIFPPAIPTLERGSFMLLRTDFHLDEKHRLAVRFNHANIFVENNIQGGLSTLERSSDVENADHAVAVQLASYSSSLVNEFRFQFARRASSVLRNEFSGQGPSIVIANVANFGAPEGADIPPWIDKSVQAQNNLTHVNGGHLFKFGAGVTISRNSRTADVFARYTFSSIQAYLDARNGIHPRSYTRYNESSGDPSLRLGSAFLNLFAQDDWKVTSRLKLTYGARYDLYKVPEGDPSAAFPTTRRFNVDKDNLAPRFAAVYLLHGGERPTVVRAAGGMYYEQPWLDMYEQALRQNGSPAYFNFTVSPTSPSAPNFPAVFPPGLQLSNQDVEIVASDLENLYAVHANIQLEQAISGNVSIAAGYFHSGGRHISAYRSINYIPIRHLADGRPVFSQIVNPATRFDPRFNNILIAESAGTSSYDALTVQLIARNLKGVNISAHYTLSKATDDAPEQNIAFPNGTNLFLANPLDRSFERGRSFTDQRHTFAVSMVAQPKFEVRSNFLRRVLNHNQLAVIATANSGYAFNIVSETDLNADGFRHDRPLGIARNSGTTPPIFNLDLRYSRFVPMGGSMRFEVFTEFTNVFNVSGIVQFNNISVPTNSDGELIGSLPDLRARNQSTFQESRQFQVGVRFFF